MTIAELADIAAIVLQGLAKLADPPATASDLLSRIKADEADLQGGEAADDAAAQGEIDKRFPPG